MYKFINKILSSKKSGMPIDNVSHNLALKVLLDVNRKYAAGKKIVQLSDIGFFIKEIKSVQFRSINYLKKLTKLNYLLFIHSPSKRLLNDLFNSKNTPTQVCLLTHNLFCLDNLLTKLGHFLKISSSKTDRFILGRDVIKLFNKNGYEIIFDEGSFFGSKMLLVLLPTYIQKIYGKYLFFLENTIKKYLPKFCSRNRVMVFAKNTYLINHKNKLNQNYIKETINFDNKYNKKTYYGKFYFENVKRLMEVSNPKPVDRVLDIGTGTGTFALNAARKGSCVHAVDISELMISVAIQKAEKIGVKNKIKFICADAENLPFKNNFFDIIYSASVPHDVNDFEKYLEEIHRVLKPKGRVYLNIYNFFTPAGFYYLLRMIFGRLQR